MQLASINQDRQKNEHIRIFDAVHVVFTSSFITLSRTILTMFGEHVNEQFCFIQSWAWFVPFCFKERSNVLCITL